MDLWGTVDFTKSIKSYEYTRHAKYQIYQAIESDDFREMDSQTIFDFILNKMEIVPFNNYLRRFVYQKCQMMEDITDYEYTNIIYNSFVEKAAPYSFSPIKKKMRPVIKDWLKKNAVKRETIFIVGFGLGMDETEVSEFLTKVNKEESFDFGNPQEAVFWYCYHNHEGYAKAKEWLAFYEQADTKDCTNESLWEAMRHDPRMYIHSEKELALFLRYLKAFQNTEKHIREEFLAMYSRVQELVASISKILSPVEGSHDCPKEEVTPQMIESMLYSGIRKENRLKKMSLSILAGQFTSEQRLNRIHMYNVLAGRDKASRYDFITMLFLLYANNIYYEYDPEDRRDGAAERVRDYIDEINRVLERCNMAGIYPVNPYEAFVLMCLATDDPLDVFCEVWEFSFKGNGKQISSI